MLKDFKKWADSLENGIFEKRGEDFRHLVYIENGFGFACEVNNNASKFSEVFNVWEIKQGKYKKITKFEEEFSNQGVDAMFTSASSNKSIADQLTRLSMKMQECICIEEISDNNLKHLKGVTINPLMLILFWTFPLFEKFAKAFFSEENKPKSRGYVNPDLTIRTEFNSNLFYFLFKMLQSKNLEDKEIIEMLFSKKTLLKHGFPLSFMSAFALIFYKVIGFRSWRVSSLAELITIDFLCELGEEIRAGNHLLSLILEPKQEISGAIDEKNLIINRTSYMPESRIYGCSERYGSTGYEELLLDIYPSMRLLGITIKELLTYLDRTNKCHGLTVNLSLSLYKDYLKYSFKLYGAKTKKFPSKLVTEHDRVSENHQSITNSISPAVAERIVKKYAALSFIDEQEINETHIIITPKNHQDIIDEGYELSHCVGNYVQNIADNNTTILFVRNKEKQKKSLYTIEIRNKKIIQSKGKSNSPVPFGILNDLNVFLEKMFKEAA